jgi:hypothetical protein
MKLMIIFLFFISMKMQDDEVDNPIEGKFEDENDKEE